MPQPTTQGRRTGHPRYSETLPRQPESAATARRLLRTACAVWGLDALAEDGALIVSELVANAVQHARRESIRVVIDRPGALFLSEPAFLVFVTRTVGLTPFQVGLVFSASGAGAFAGALAATRAADRLGVPLALTGSLATAGAASAIVPAAAMAPQGLAPALIAVAHFVMSATVIVFNVTQRSLRTSLTPADLYGRMNASIRMIVMGAAPVGGLLGGWLSATAGPRAALVVGALGMATACAWLRPFRPAGRDGTGAGTGPSIPAPRRESAPPASGPLPGRRRQDRTAADGHGRGSPSA